MLVGFQLMELLFIIFDSFNIIFPVNLEFMQIPHVFVSGNQVIGVQERDPYNKNYYSQDIFIPDNSRNLVDKFKPDNHDANLQFFF
jgi:hypothetical protein